MGVYLYNIYLEHLFFSMEFSQMYIVLRLPLIINTSIYNRWLTIEELF